MQYVDTFTVPSIVQSLQQTVFKMVDPQNLITPRMAQIFVDSYRHLGFIPKNSLTLGQVFHR